MPDLDPVKEIDEELPLSERYINGKRVIFVGSMEKRYLFYERTKRIGRVALASLLLVEPMISAYGSEKTKEFKNQMSNSIKVERMGDKMGSLKTVTIAEQAKKDIYALINASDMPTKTKYFNEINEKRDKKSKNYSKEYDEAYKQIWNKLSKEEKDIFNRKWKEAAEEIKKTPPKTFIEFCQSKGWKIAEFYISGSGTETSVNYYAIAKVETQNGKTYWYGIKGSKDNEYGYTYEWIGKRTKTGEGTKEWEMIGKDLIAALSKWEENEPRFAQIRYALSETGSSVYLFVSGESGTASYINIKQEADGSTTLNIQGSPASFNLLWERILRDKDFYKYTGAWEVIGKIGLINNVNSIVDLVGRQMMLTNGDLTVQLSIGDKVTTELYKGGTIKVNKDYSIAISAPFIEKGPDMEKPQMFVLVYKMDSKGKFLGSEKIEITNETPISIGSTELNLKVTPSRISMNQVISMLNNQTWVLNLDGTKVPITPSINNSYIYHSKNGDYRIILKNVKPIEPILKSTLDLQGEIDVVDLKTNETRSFVIDLGSENKVRVGDRDIALRLESPSSMTITNSMEYIEANLNVNTTEFENEKKEKFYINTISWNGTTKASLLPGNEAQFGIKFITLSKGPFEEKQKKLEEEEFTTRKHEEIRAEELARYRALGTAFGFEIKDFVGLSFNVNNAEGVGVWGVYYDPTSLIQNGITSSGDALKQLTVKTKKIGWSSLGLTGATAYEQEQLTKKDAKIDSIKDVTGLGLWLYLDTYGLHGEGRVVNEDIKEKVTRTVEINTTGERTEALFNAWDPNREGPQILAFRYSQEKKSGKEGGNSVDILRSDYFTSLGYRKNTDKEVVSSIYGKMNILGFKDKSDEILSNKASTIENLADTTFKQWNPVLGFSTKYGAWEIGARWATSEEYNRAKSLGLTTNSNEIKEKGYNLIMKGVPLFGKLEVNGSYDFTKRDNVSKTNDIINAISTGKDQIIELQPILRFDKDKYAYLSVITELNETTMNSITSETKTKFTKKEIRPGYKNKWLELNTFYITNDQKTVTKTISDWEKVRQNQKQLGINLFGKASENVEVNLSYSRTTDSSGTYWMVNGGLRLKL